MADGEEAEHKCEANRYGGRAHGVKGGGDTPFLKAPNGSNKVTNVMHHHCHNMSHISPL